MESRPDEEGKEDVRGSWRVKNDEINWGVAEQENQSQGAGETV